MISTYKALGLCVLALSALSGCSSTFGPAAEPPLSAPSSDTLTQQTVSEDAGGPALVAVSTGSYQLGEGDQIAIQVFDEPDLTMDARVSASGIINYSYLGDLQVGGKTSQELERHITELLRNGYLVNPSVNITIKEYRPFYIGGEVRSPGSYPYQPGLTLNRAIALAGGLTDRASARRIFVVRPSGEEFRASLSQAISPGDTISIKEGFF